MEAAGLRYSTDEQPGITRRRAGTGFAYRTPGGAPLRDRRQLARIRALAIPPAWQSVWISSDPCGHLQATGRDARGRKQYLYHRDWRALRDGTKFDRMLEFGTSLPRLRDRIERDLALPGLPRERVLAAVVRLIDDTLIRVGNERYLRANGSFGATTMRKQHAAVNGRRIAVEFKGKSGKLHQSEINDHRLARTMQQLHELPGRELFEYLDDDGMTRRRIHSGDVNDYLREIGAGESTVKDFRTWGASALCVRELCLLGPPGSETAAARAIASAIREVATELGNTPSVCRASYVHPALLETYAAGGLPPVSSRTLRGLDRWESGLMRFLRARS
ncbi:MAG: topoisomerase [Gaiellales bacterium]|nr:topoisomerase [Gaiellales bacterium]